MYSVFKSKILILLTVLITVSIFQIPANILCILLCNWKYLGRRGTNCLGLVVAGVASLLSIPLILDGGKIAFTITIENQDKCPITSIDIDNI